MYSLARRARMRNPTVQHSEGGTTIPDRRTRKPDMATKNLRKNAKDSSDRYFELVRQFPLRPIRSDAELDRAIALLDSLVDREDLDPDESDYLDVLGDIVEKYEGQEHPIAPASDA